MFEERLRLIEGAPAAFATASGMAAVFTSLRALTADELIVALGVPESDVVVLGASDASALAALATALDIATARDRARQVAAALGDSRG